MSHTSLLSANSLSETPVPAKPSRHRRVRKEIGAVTGVTFQDHPKGASEGVVVMDQPAERQYPLATDVAGSDSVFVGRIREDVSIENGLNMWVVADNLRKGAALNAVQIAERLLNIPK